MMLALPPTLVLAVLAVPSAAPPAPVSAAPREAKVVEIETRDRVELAARFLPPPSGRQKAPGALLVHDAGGQRDELDAIAERLNKQGFGVLVLDLRGHGGSANRKWDWSTRDDGEREALWAFALRDLEAGAEFLADDSGILSTSLVVVGHGAGSALAARHAARDQNVRALALLDPPTAALGFDLRTDIADLAGLPCMVAATAGRQTAAQDLGRAGKESNGGRSFVELSILRKAEASVLEDSRLPTQLAKWLSDQAQPKRGR